MRFQAYEDVWDGSRVVVLKDALHDSEAMINLDIGFNLIRCRLGGHDTIEGPEDLSVLSARSSEFGVPLLWPPGRIAGGKFSFEGRPYTYPLHEGVNHLHGEIRMMPWQISGMEANECQGANVTAELHFTETDVNPAYYPHAVVLRMTWKLQGDRISGRLIVENEGETEVPFGFGLHPYFSFRGSMAGTDVTAAVTQQYFADEDGIMRNIPVQTELCQDLLVGMPLDKLPKDTDHFVFRMDQDVHCCEIIRHQEQIRIKLEFDQSFPYLVVFKPLWADAISFEPWTCVSDANNSPLPPEWSGVSGLPAGACRELQWSWQAESLA
ncbi:aldose 1-epimerase [Paenibacillus dokdonensis]|uniref:aldose 1-epimerase n=1 Tax=Paenibacillus dokdonensis TaxID=2567944 RepID=UPI001457D8DB|nr:aldose 1-epimerase [Paenibacillus dokdonensis]